MCLLQVFMQGRNFTFSSCQLSVGGGGTEDKMQATALFSRYLVAKGGRRNRSLS